MQPWFGASSRVRQRVEFDLADYDLTFKLRSACRKATRDGRTAACRPMSRQRHRSAFPAALNGSASAAAARSSPPLTGGAPRAGRARRARHFWRGALECERAGDFTAGVRGERISRDALPGDPLAFQPRPDFLEETITSVNPKIAASFAVTDRTRLARLVRHRHPPAGRLRDRIHRQFGIEAGAQQERRVRAHADHRRRRHTDRRHRVLQLYTDLIISVGRTFYGSEPLPHRQHLERAPAARSVRGVAACCPVRCASELHVPRHRDSRGERPVDRADAPTRWAIRCCAARVTWGNRRDRHAGPRQRVRADPGAGETLDAEPAFGPSGGLYTNEGHTIVNIGGLWRPVRRSKYSRAR